jgi:uncharacterized protein YjbI with pentapeptide repeats
LAKARLKSRRKTDFFFLNQALAAYRQNGAKEISALWLLHGYRMTAVRRISFSKLTQKEVSAAVARHEMLYAGRMGGARAVFAFCDLSGLDLTGRNLADADFTGALLEETNLAGTKLDSASFFGADLRRANLAASSMRRADMRGASLRGANLIGADLYEADLREGTIAEKDRFGNLRVLQHDIGNSEMGDALMHSANLERAKMAGTMAIQADFTDAVMRNCKLSRANLRNAKLTGANLENADLSGCVLSGADLTGSILVGAHMSMTMLDGANMSGALTEAGDGKHIAALMEMLQSHALWAESDGREGKPADLSGRDLRELRSLSHRQLTALIAPGAMFYGLDLEGASLQGSNLAGADLRGCRLAGADLRGANLSGAKLGNANLHDAKLGPLLISDQRLLPARLDNANARYADFRGADMRRIRMPDADLSYANLTGADVRDCEFGGAIFSGAKLPPMLMQLTLPANGI